MTSQPGGVLVYDGDCGFCTTSAAWIRRRLDPTYRVEPWQHLDLGAYGLTETETTAAAYWVDRNGTTHRGHLAIAESLAASSAGHWRLLGQAMRLPPLRWLAAPAYRLVARHRHKLPGGTDVCRVRG